MYSRELPCCSSAVVPITENDQPVNITPAEEEILFDEKLLYTLLEIFPEACPIYIRTLCRGKSNTPEVVDALIAEILNTDYPKRLKASSPAYIMSLEEQFEMMEQILPDADPDFLYFKCEELHNQPDALPSLINRLVETKQYPTKKDYLRKQQLSAQQKQYTTEFSVEKFLEIIPDPHSHFNDQNRIAKLSPEGIHYALCFLRNRFRWMPMNTIRSEFHINKSNVLMTCNSLEKSGKVNLLKNMRKMVNMPDSQEIPLLQEIAYIEHKEEILHHIEAIREKEQEEMEEAKRCGFLQTCLCCYDNEVMLKNIHLCENGCMFCKECIKKSIEVTFGSGKLDFPCLADCSSTFSLHTLQAVLNPKTFSIIALKKQVEEVKAAGIEDLEVCPFCDFASIPASGDKLFRCLNPECMKESCRLCKEPSHVPLRCEEVEKEDDVKRRTYVEDKMTEALLRKCYNCGMKFIKMDGCNKMTCSCGAKMCYICEKPVQDYSHFNGNGGTNFHLCPLYSDTNKLHVEAVLAGASRAKEDVGANVDPSKLKSDPAADVRKHYQ